MTTFPIHSQPIRDVKLGEYIIYEQAVGDTWDPAWAPDGQLYFPGNDGSGWGKACSSNVFFNRATGEDFRSLAGQTVSGMPEYGGWAKKGPDGCTWKSSGCISVDGALYFAIARHAYGTESGDPYLRQTARRASIIKSIDHGLTWERRSQENYDHPMFVDGRFTTPYFIHYGQDGEPGDNDGSGHYVYAISNNGFWCNGDNYILGRVAKNRLGRLNPADWSYYQGGDGLLDGSWGQDMHRASLIIDNPRKCGETGATYLPSLRRYVLVAWYYPGDPNVDTDETRLIFYESPRPWGPWAQVREIASRPEGWYCPRVLARWQVSQGDEITGVVVTGGDYYEMEKYYRFTVVPVHLKTGGLYPPPAPAPEPIVVGSSQVGEGWLEFSYTGSWNVNPDRAGALGGRERYSNTANDTFSLKFEGNRIRWYASKENNLGIAAVSIDGREEILVDQYTYCHVPQYGRLLFDSGLLSPGAHTFNVRVTGLNYVHSRDCFVSNDWVEIQREADPESTHH